MPAEATPAPPPQQHLFRPARIGCLALKNRVVALPLFTGYAHPDGKVSPLMIEHYWRLARSGVAMVVVGNAAVSRQGATSPCSLRAHGNEFVPGLARLAGTIRKSGALACLQLNHGGPFAKSGRPLVPSPIDGANVIHDVASLRAFMKTFPVKLRFGLTRQLMEMVTHWQRPMTAAERRQVIADFGDAAHRARMAGFDMVELHGGTGYLLASYLSAYSNKIPAGLAERAAFPLQVLQEVRRRLPGEFPVGFRLMVREWVPGGIDLEEAIGFARMLETHGAAYLSVTAGSYTSMFKPEVARITARPAHLARDGAALKSAVGLPVILSGRLFTPLVAAKVLQRGAADLIGLARPLLADPRWLEKAAAGRKVTVCINCGNCLERVILDAGVTCTRWPKADQARIDLETSILSRRLSRFLVVASDLRDLRAIRVNWPFRAPQAQDARVRFLFLQGAPADPRFKAAITPFLSWARRVRGSRAAAKDQLDWVMRTARQPLDKEVIQETEQGGDFGVILLGMAPDQPWRERLAARHTTGVIGFLGAHPHPHKVLVPFDLTAVSQLVLHYIHHAYYRDPRFDFTFAHVLEGDGAAVRRRWRQTLATMGWDEDTALKMLPARRGVAEDLLAEMRAGAHGTVLMGRRNITGIRRWLLGSVSAGVMRGITDQNITLVG
jgi:2,4-dienoyl-CoA reductase-like NADH-dependent reductase (Old Yellow Enzyme family)